jgi:hypothetical protein
MQIRPQQFTALVAATAISVVVAAATYAYFNRWSAGRVEGVTALPALTRQAASVAAVEITQGERKLTLQRAGDQWRIKERDGYPAAADRVRALLVTLQDAELIEPKTAIKDKLKLLELEDPAAKDAKSRLVRILDTKGGIIGEVVVGKSRDNVFGASKGGTYVRRPAETQAWLAKGEPKTPLDMRDWVQSSIFDLDQSKMEKITLEHAGEEPLVIEKGDGKDQKFKLAAMPEDKKLKQGVTLDQIAQGFSSMSLEDVRKMAAPPAADGVSVLKLEAEGGLAVTFRLRREADQSWVSLAATGADGDAKKKADEINAQANGWEFKIPQWKADQIGKRRADIFETS